MTTSDTATANGDFAAAVVGWQRRFGRHHLPWQNTTDPYRIWLSEIMLQQTQVAAVVPYFERFLERFPALGDLAQASEDDVLAMWSGLGYYARGRNLHRAAKQIAAEYGGTYPERFDDILALPGVGRSTAGAVAVFAFGQRFAILDGNVKRVLTRCFGIEGYPGTAEVAARLWQLAESLLPSTDIKAYTQGLMDLGSEVCTRSRPRCSECPLSSRCLARSLGQIDRLPTPRPRRKRPQRETVMMVLQCDESILMEKRAAQGIWGGLWSFPETGSMGDVPGECLTRFGLEAQTVIALSPIEHGFTHYSLTITPALCRVGKRVSSVQEAGGSWFALEEAGNHAIPVPVRKLLDRLRALPTDGTDPVRTAG